MFILRHDNEGIFQLGLPRRLLHGPYLVERATAYTARQMGMELGKYVLVHIAKMSGVG